MSNIRIGHMTLGIYQTNCYFVYRENSDKVLVYSTPRIMERKLRRRLDSTDYIQQRSF